MTGDSCGQYQVCVEYQLCPVYVQTFNSLATIKETQARQYKEGMDRLKKKVCEQNQKKICCEVPNRDSDTGNRGQSHKLRDF